jgi:molybdopterin/thiamine biosynthesis adenylyltransferase
MNHRYARIEKIEALGPGGLQALQRATIAIVGVGNIGGEAARHLAMLGIKLVLIDGDTVKAVNLGTQGFSGEQLGLAKVEARRRSLCSLNPATAITTIDQRIERLGLGALRDVDLILCCLDSRRMRVMVSEIAARLAIPWIDAAVDGSGKSFFGRVAAYDPRRADAACYLCPHDRKSLDEIRREGAEAGCPLWTWNAASLLTAPTLAISALGAAVAAVQVIWGLKLLLGDEEMIGRELYLDLDQSVVSTHRLKRNPECLFDHQAFNLVPVGRRVDEMTARETFAFAEERLGREVTLQLHHRALVTELTCPLCKANKPMMRTLEAIKEEQTLCECGVAMEPRASALLERFGRGEAEKFFNRTWGELGLPARDVITAKNRQGELHLLIDQSGVG